MLLQLILFVLLLVAGCQQKSTEPEAGSSDPSLQPAESGSAASFDVPVADPPKESWDVILVQGEKIGYMHSVETPVTIRGSELVRYQVDSKVEMRRFGQVVKQDVKASSLETQNGQVREFECRMASGGAEAVTKGICLDGVLRMETKTLGKTQTNSLPWDDSAGGFSAVEKSLLKSPLKPGEKRRLSALVPIFNAVAEMRLEAGEMEETPLLTGSRRLLRVKQAIQLGGTAIESVCWTDEQGRMLKVHMPDMDQTVYRTTKAVALHPQAATFDLGTSTLVRLAKPADETLRTKRVVYRAKLPRGDPSKAFANTLSQQVKKVDEHVAEITVIAVRPDHPESLTAPLASPTDADRNPNNLIQSDDEQVRKLARSIAPDETDPWRLVQAMEKYVDEFVVAHPDAQAIASAADVVRTRKGDCTEHAVLLAACCRARQIPARVAVGLVYVPSPRPERAGFAYHMWTEAWIKDRWVPVDATRGDGGIGGGHLLLATSHLHGVDAFSVLLPVFQVIGQLQLEVVSVD